MEAIPPGERDSGTTGKQNALITSNSASQPRHGPLLGVHPQAVPDHVAPNPPPPKPIPNSRPAGAAGRDRARTPLPPGTDDQIWSGSRCCLRIRTGGNALLVSNGSAPTSSMISPGIILYVSRNHPYAPHPRRCG